MRICIVSKGKFEDLPQIMSLAIHFHTLGHEVEVVTSFCEEETKLRFSDKGIAIHPVLQNYTGTSTPTKLHKLYLWRQFSKRAWRHIDLYAKRSLLWISTGDTALSLGKKLLGRSFVLHLQELYDNELFYRRMLAQYARKAICLVVPEVCRAAIFRMWYGLDSTPFVLPNKSFEHPRQRRIHITDDFARCAINKIGHDTKLVLYQGHVGPDRDIRPVTDAVNALSQKWRLIVMGPTDKEFLKSLILKCPDLTWIPKIMSPSHLQITSHAHIGIIHYSYNGLNNVFCAPNKTWEYSGFGIPTLCNDLPPLQFSIQKTGAGLCLASWDSETIQKALLKIDSQYDLFSNAALQLYESLDVNDVLQSILSKVEETSSDVILGQNDCIHNNTVCSN